MRTIEPRTTRDPTVQELAERMADLFRTGVVDDVVTDDLFLDGHPPLWRFQLQGRRAFADWLSGYAPDGSSVTVVRTVPTVDGFVAELVGEHLEDGVPMTDRKIVLCAVTGGAISEMVVYCSGDWDPELRARHAAETELLRP